MKNQIRSLIAFVTLAVLGLLASPAYADLWPNHTAINPEVCDPPTPPQPGQPGYGPENPLTGGIFYDPNTGFWYIPDGLYNGDQGERMIQGAEDIELMMRPAWASAPPVNGTYYFNGGFWGSSNWYEPGYYFPYEIY